MIATKTLDWSPAQPERALTLPARYFYDAGVFEAERERIFYPAWHCVAHANELKEPGDFATVDILDQSVIVTRGDDGVLRGFHNVCQHRGNRLLNTRRGKLGAVLRCGYHSWCYGRDGELKSAPRSERLPDFDRRDFGLKPVRVETLGNFVFMSLDPNAAPLAEVAPGAEAKMQQFLPDLAGMKLISEVDVVVPANWKIIMDNSIEGYHFALSGPVHKELATLIDFRKYSLQAHDKWWTYIGPPRRDPESAYGVPLLGATWQTDSFFNLGIWPNTTFYCFPYADLCGTFIMIPLEPEKSLLRFGYYGPDRATPAVTTACIKWMNEKLGPEDIELNVTNQRGLRSFGYNQGRYLIDAERSNESEHLVHHFHSLVHQAIRAGTRVVSKAPAYDYVIVGAGSAGCVLAARLTEDPDLRVLLLEAGPQDRAWEIDMPSGLGRLLATDRFNWAYVSDPEPYLDNRRLSHPRGRVLGGSSSINGMMYVRGHARDYDRWAQSGAQGWRYADLLPYFKRAEHHQNGAGPYHGGEGPLRVTSPNGQAGPLSQAFIEAGRQAGYPATADCNGAQQEGFGPCDRTTHNGKRWSTARGYLDPVRQRANLTITTGALALAVLFEGKRATGIAYAVNGVRQTVHAEREVILCGGAINSPQLLQLSGIGDPALLQRLGIKLQQALPGVGANLSDHPDIVVQYACTQPVTLAKKARAPGKFLTGAQWFLAKSGPAASNHFEAGGFIRSRAGIEHPDLQFTFMPLAVKPGTVETRPEHAFQVHIDLMRPESVGRVEARSADPRQAPSILFNYLQRQRDRDDFRRSVALIREIIAQAALDPYRGAELFPGPDIRSDAEIDAFVRQAVETCYHPVGTCRMGRDTEASAVVDDALRVHGVDGLRVVDASIMPSIVSGNTNAPTIMIAEKAADMIRGKAPLPPSDAPVWIHPNWETQQR